MMILSLQGDMATTNSLLNPINLEAPYLSLSVAVAVSAMMCACSGIKPQISSIRNKMLRNVSPLHKKNICETNTTTVYIMPCTCHCSTVSFINYNIL